jgi:tricorn protease
MNQGYYRFPAIYGERVVFVCEDDLWEVPLAGGRAQRLTANLGLITYPAFAPDGQYLAFVGREEGQEDIYAIPSLGGPARRLTYIGDWRTRTAGWSPDGKVIFCSNHRQPIFRWQELWSVDLAGSAPQPLNLGPARALAFGPEGGRVLGRNTDDPRHWKRDRGGTIGTLWIDPDGCGNFRSLVQLAGDLGSPMWVGERIYFLSDHEGIGNLYSCLPGGDDLRRHTLHDQYYAYNARTDGQRIVYHSGAEIYCYDPQVGASRHVPVEFHSSRTQHSRKFSSAAAYLESWRLSPDGTRLALSARGQLFSMRNWDGAAAQHRLDASTPGRYRLPRYLQDGQRLVALSDQDGEERFVIVPVKGQLPPTCLPLQDTGKVVEIIPNPHKDQVAFSNQRGELWVLDLQSQDLRLVDRLGLRSIRLDRWAEARGAIFDWSPDGEWLVYSRMAGLYHSQICLWQAASGETFPITQPVFKDESPSFDPQGSYIYFISYRSFTPYADNQVFGASFPKAMKLYLIPLRKELTSPFAPMAQAPGPAGTFRIDLEDIQNRLVAFPLEEGQYGRVFGLLNNKVAYSIYPLEGIANADWESQPVTPGSLCVYDLTGRDKKVIASDMLDFHVSMDRGALIYRQGGRLRVVDPRQGFDPAAGETPGPKGGWLDLERIKLSVQPAEEWRQMFSDAWRLQRDYFWTANMSQVDWPAVYQRYQPLVARVASRSELSALIWEMQSELGIGHAYEDGGDHRRPPDYRQGWLGADFEYDPHLSGWRITHLVQGDVWDEKATSPLSAPGLGIQEGDVLAAINGQPLSPSFSPSAALVNQAGMLVSLVIQRQSAGADSQDETSPEVTVRTLRDEMPARYREWVAANRQLVHTLSSGRVGYLHIPDMESFGIAEFHRGFLEEFERQALIVDARYNTGGYASPLMLEKLSRRRIGFNLRRWSQIPDTYPPYAPAGPMVALANEFTGSDGDLFSQGFKALNLGPLVGHRTWGGIIGIAPRNPLVDHTVTTQPEIAFGFPDLGWSIENHGVVPDIEFENLPQDYTRGVDMQLQRAIAEALRLVVEQPGSAFQPPEPPDRPLPSGLGPN